MIFSKPDNGYAQVIPLRPGFEIPTTPVPDVPHAVVIATPFAVALMAEVDFQLADRNDTGDEEASTAFEDAKYVRHKTQAGLSLQARQALRSLATEAIESEGKN